MQFSRSQRTLDRHPAFKETSHGRHSRPYNGFPLGPDRRRTDGDKIAKAQQPASRDSHSFVPYVLLQSGNGHSIGGLCWEVICVFKFPEPLKFIVLRAHS